MFRQGPDTNFLPEETDNVLTDKGTRNFWARVTLKTKHKTTTQPKL